MQLMLNWRKIIIFAPQNFSMVYHINGFASVKQYSEISGRKTRTIREQIQRGSSSAMLIDGEYFIRVQKQPLQNAVVGEIFDETKTPIKSMTLASVARLSEKLKIRSSTIFEKIIAGEMDAYVIGGITHIDIAKNPPESFSFIRRKK